MKTRPWKTGLVGVGLATAMGAGPVLAASHREAPADDARSRRRHLRRPLLRRIRPGQPEPARRLAHRDDDHERRPGPGAQLGPELLRFRRQRPLPVQHRQRSRRHGRRRDLSGRVPDRGPQSRPVPRHAGWRPAAADQRHRRPRQRGHVARPALHGDRAARLQGRRGRGRSVGRASCSSTACSSPRCRPTSARARCRTTPACGSRASGPTPPPASASSPASPARPLPSTSAPSSTPSTCGSRTRRPSRCSDRRFPCRRPPRTRTTPRTRSASTPSAAST